MVLAVQIGTTFFIIIISEVVVLVVLVVVVVVGCEGIIKFEVRFPKLSYSGVGVGHNV